MNLEGVKIFPRGGLVQEGKVKNSHKGALPLTIHSILYIQDPNYR